MWSCDPATVTNLVNTYEAAGPLFMGALQSILAAQCALVGDHLWPPDATHHVIQDPNYDFVVIGAGSAGAVLANRLSEIPDWKVLLVEAGGNPTLTTEIPQIFYSNLKTNEDWGYKMQPQDNACRGYKNGQCAWPRGKVLGGCSSINAMFYVRGNKADYDEWSTDGNYGWNYEEILKYYKKSENFTGDKIDSRYHGTGGYLNVESTPEMSDFEMISLKANEEIGLKILDDVNGDNQIGVSRAFSTTKEGIRQSTARAFLSSIKDRKNLHVIRNAYASKILFKDDYKTVEGVVIRKDDKDIVINVKKELIVSAGAINSPQLLLLSGIGPKKQLEDLNIKVVKDLNVGENLQDHLFVPIYYIRKTDKEYTSLSNILKSFVQYMLQSEGPLSDLSPHRVIDFINTTDPTSKSPDIQHHYVFLLPNQSNLLDVYDKHDLSEEYQKQFKEVNKNNFVLILYTVLLKPKSRGRIVLKSNNPFDHPLIYGNYFDDPDDLKVVIRGMRHALKLEKTNVFRNSGFQLHWMDLEPCRNLDKDTDDYLECVAKEITFSLYHPTGSVKMGPTDDPTSVVDPELKVIGIKGLRVIDASIMPKIVSGNTNGPTIMIGERGSDIIKNDWLSKHTEL